MKKHNILVVIHCIPYPLSSGGRQAIYNGIRAIMDDYNIFITYPTTTHQEQVVNELLDSLDNKVKILPYIEPNQVEAWTLRRKIAQRLERLKDLLYPPRQTQKNPYAQWINLLLPPSKDFIAFIQDIIRKYDIDTFQCEMLKNLSLVQSLPPNVKKVFVHHELGFARHQLELQTVHSDYYDGHAYLACAKALEIGQLNQYDQIITLSSTDSAKLQDAGVTTAIEPSFAIVRPAEKPLTVSQEFRELVFVGPDNHPPNYIGLKWFLDNCWEDLLKRDANYRLKIIGLWNQQNQEQLAAQYRNITFCGFVKDLADSIKDAIMIVPITIGSGIRMKILEAANLGVPFVSTTVGAEGIPLINGKHCMLADSPEDFVEAIIKMQDGSLRTQLIQQANLLIRERYSFDALRQNRLAIYKKLYASE